MNIERIGSGGLGLLMGFALLTLVSPAHAVHSFNFTIQDDWIEVGEDFEVAFTGTFDSGLELVSFAFDVDPFGSLITKGAIEFKGWSIAAPLSAFSLGEPDVGALNVNPFDPLFGGVNVPLAILNFTALSAGTDAVQILGLQGSPSYQGVTLFDFGNNEFETYDLEASIEVIVNSGAKAVPDSPVYGALPALMIGIAFYRRLQRRE